MKPNYLKKETSPEILLNLMYNGKYLRESNNIGYEIINLFKSDQGDNYIYILPYGNYDKSRNIKDILLVRKIEGIPVLEVLGKASKLEPIYNPYLKDEKNHETQLDLAKSITYGGVSINDIFRDADTQDIYVSFKANSVVRPAKKILIRYDAEWKKEYNLPECDKLIDIMGVGLAKQAQKQYFCVDDEYSENYKKLKRLIDDRRLWLGEDSIESVVLENKVNLEDFTLNIFDICGIQDRELAFSNALAHFISKYPNLFVEFAKTLGIKIHLNEGKSLQVVRESEENIDLLIKCKSHLIVVENKIRSGINGIDDRENKHLSQLDKYYKYIQETYTEKKKDNREKLFYVLKPDYSKIEIEEYEKLIPKKDKYKIINYSQIYDFLGKKIDGSPYKEDTQLKEFYRAIKKHSQSVYEDQFEIMKQKFQRIIHKRLNERKA